MQNSVSRQQSKGLGLICNSSGQILQRIRDDLGIMDGLVAGNSTLLQWLDRGSFQKFDDFLMALRDHQTELNYELNFKVANTVVPLSISGILEGEKIYLIAFERTEEVDRLYNEIMSIMNGQVSQLRQASKEHEETIQRNNRELDEFSRLTNELIIAQSELAKKNLELEKANAQLYELATHDMLTGAENRRFFFERLEEELRAFERTGHPLALLWMDIDHFKRINDTFGHLVGDKVLQSVGEVHRSLLRSIDHFCRFGGEEFAILLPDTDYEGAIVVAERLRKSLAENGYESRKGKVSFTVSIGVGVVKDEPMNLEELLEAVDTFLYQAKHQGRNCVVGGYLNGKSC